MIDSYREAIDRYPKTDGLKLSLEFQG